MGPIQHSQNEWGTKERTTAWKSKTCIVWFVIVTLLSVLGFFAAFFLLFHSRSANVELTRESSEALGGEVGALVGRFVGAIWGFLLAVGWFVILSRPTNRKPAE